MPRSAILAEPMSAAKRRHVAAASVAGLYADAGMPLEARHARCLELRDAWLPDGSIVGVALAPQERAERGELATIVAALEGVDAEPAIAALQARSGALSPLLGRLRALDGEGVLEQPFEQVMSSLGHMAVNRLLQHGGSIEEARVHHALARIYEAQIARRRSELACDSVGG